MWFIFLKTLLRLVSCQFTVWDSLWKVGNCFVIINNLRCWLIGCLWLLVLRGRQPIDVILVLCTHQTIVLSNNLLIRVVLLSIVCRELRFVLHEWVLILQNNLSWLSGTDTALGLWINFLILFAFRVQIVDFASGVHWTRILACVILLINSCVIDLLLNTLSFCSLRQVANDYRFLISNNIRFLTDGPVFIKVISCTRSWTILRTCVHVDFLLLYVKIIHACEVHFYCVRVALYKNLVHMIRNYTCLGTLVCHRSGWLRTFISLLLGCSLFARLQ